MSPTYATIHAAQDLIHALQNPAPASLPVALGNAQKESVIYLAEIFGKATYPSVPPRVPVRGAYQEKLQQVKQEETQIKNSSQSKRPFTNAEPPRFPIVETYSGELQQVCKKSNKVFQPRKNSAVTLRKMKIVKNENWDNKSGYTRSAAPYDTRS